MKYSDNPILLWLIAKWDWCEKQARIMEDGDVLTKRYVEGMFRGRAQACDLYLDACVWLDIENEWVNDSATSEQFDEWDLWQHIRSMELEDLAKQYKEERIQMGIRGLVDPPDQDPSEGQDPSTYAGPEGPRPAEDTPPGEPETAPEVGDDDPHEDEDSRFDDDNEE